MKLALDFKLKSKKSLTTFLSFGVAVLIILVGTSTYYVADAKNKLRELTNENTAAKGELDKTRLELEKLSNEDQVKKNKDLETEVANINQTYNKSISVYEELLKLKDKSTKTEALDELYAQAVAYLAQKNYASASAVLASLETGIKEEEGKITASVTIPQNVPESSTPPSAGYSRQSVNSDAGSFMVSLVAADLGSTQVIVDTASSADCFNDCPVLALADYVSKNGAFAGINGTYFCPSTYPSCAGKTNTFDLLVMNKNKYYFNSSNNVYSNNPAVIFGSGYIRFVGAASQWGRDTGIDSMLSNYPLLVSGGNVAFGGDDDPKKGSKGGRSFVANKGNTVYIGVVHSATVAEAARVLKAMGMENALNLDNGGSTALWSGGYKVGPGRNLPNTILFVRK